jgi:hypothetical protein
MYSEFAYVQLLFFICVEPNNFGYGPGVSAPFVSIDTSDVTVAIVSRLVPLDANYASSFSTNGLPAGFMATSDKFLTDAVGIKVEISSPVVTATIVINLHCLVVCPPICIEPFALCDSDMVAHFIATLPTFVSQLLTLIAECAGALSSFGC